MRTDRVNNCMNPLTDALVALPLAKEKTPERA
jgi:hypothetical protein